MSPRCEDCRYWVIVGDVARLGECRRRAPVGGAQWTVVRRDDWCGEHEVRSALAVRDSQ